MSNISSPKDSPVNTLSRRGGTNLFLLADMRQRRYLAGLVGPKHFTQGTGEKATGEAVDVHPLSLVDGTSERLIRGCRRGDAAESKKPGGLVHQANTGALHTPGGHEAIPPEYIGVNFYNRLRSQMKTPLIKKTRCYRCSQAADTITIITAMIFMQIRPLLYRTEWTRLHLYGILLHSLPVSPHLMLLLISWL